MPILTVLLVGLGAASAHAQGINIDEGKTPPQMFASDCAVCHKAPRGLAKSSNARAVADFLRQHYTSSREQAAAMASYLLASGVGGPRAGERQQGATGGRTPPGQQRAAQPPRAPEDGIISEEQAPRPPRSVPDRGRRQATPAPAGESSDGRSGSAAARSSRRTPASDTAPATAAVETPSAAAPADPPVAAATSIEEVISRTAPAPAAEQPSGRPVPPRKDDIPD